MITTVRARIVSELEFRIGNECRGSRRDYNRDGVGNVWFAVASTELNERGEGGGLNRNRGHQFFMLLGLYQPAIQPIHSSATCRRTKFRRVWNTQLGNVDCSESYPDQSQRSHIGHRSKQSPMVTTVSDDKGV
jgi:hypothetical protein